MTETAGRQAYAAHRVSATIVLPARSTQRILQNQSPFVQLESSRARPLGKGVADAFFAAVTLREVVVGAASAALYADGARGPEAAAAIQHAVAAPSPLRLGDDRVSRRGGPLGYFAPSMAIVFLFLSVGAAANSVLSERAGGTMARLQAAPVGVGAVVAGKTLSILGLLTLSVLSMWLTTTLVFGAYWGVAIGVVVLSLATVLAIAAIGLFITVSARDLTAAQAATAGVGFLLALLGGNFFPPGSLPPLFEKLALLTPNGWALDGFTTLSLDRGQLVDIVEPVAVLLAIAALIGAAALVRFRRTLSAVAAPA
jgi:ABC-2 type transport system permease protein